MINDFLDEVWAFILYWVFGWGLLLVGIALIIWIVVRNIKSTKYKGNTEKGFIIFGLVVIAVITGFIFYNITQFAIDVDPNRMTAKEKKIEKQLEQMGE